MGSVLRLMGYILAHELCGESCFVRFIKYKITQIGHRRLKVDHILIKLISNITSIINDFHIKNEDTQHKKSL